MCYSFVDGKLDHCTIASKKGPDEALPATRYLQNPYGAQALCTEVAARNRTPAFRKRRSRTAYQEPP